MIGELNTARFRHKFQDNRLQSGDHILQIGDVNLRGMGSEQVAAVLRQSGTHVRLVVARPVEPTSPDYQVLLFFFLNLYDVPKIASCNEKLNILFGNQEFAKLCKSSNLELKIFREFEFVEVQKKN